jgi:nickel superoxide dismutase
LTRERPGTGDSDFEATLEDRTTGIRSDPVSTSEIQKRGDDMKRKAVLVIAATILVSLTASKALSHCQIPCGIYDDPARFSLMGEHITTIEKSIKTIAALSSESKPNYNQMVRWVQNKDHHADELSEIVTDYFMAQRIKPPKDTSEKAHAKYVEQITSLHQMLVYSMKAKQTTELDNVEKLRGLMEAFKASYLAE